MDPTPAQAAFFSQLVWWAFWCLLAVFPLMVLFDLVRDGWHKLSYRFWLAREGRDREELLPSPGPFNLKESNRPLRARFVRRIDPSFSSLRARGNLSVRDAEEWSPVADRGGRVGGTEERRSGS